MGSGVVLKQVDAKGEKKYVKLSGLEKARVYEMLARFGIYEMEPGEQLPEKVDGVPIVDPNNIEGTVNKAIHEDVKKQLDKLGKIDASTMHCCEAAEIIFEDIT